MPFEDRKKYSLLRVTKLYNNNIGTKYNGVTAIYWYIYNHRYMGNMFRLLSSHLQALKEYRSNYQGSQVHCGIPNVYIVTVTIWNDSILLQ